MMRLHLRSDFPVGLIRSMLIWFNHYRNSLRGLMHPEFPIAVIKLPKYLYLLGTILIATTFFRADFLAYSQLARSTQNLILANLLAGALWVAGTTLLFLDLITYSSPEHVDPRRKVAVIGLTTLAAMIDVVSARNWGAIRSELWVIVPAWVVLFFYLGYWHWSHEAFYDNEPLRALVSRVISEGIKIPLYVTVAEEDLVVDPDRPVWHESTAKGAHFYSLEAKLGFFPQYICIDAASPERDLDCVLASAAMPLGFVKSIVVNGKEYVDGGIADNCPIYPLIAIEQCTEIVVIRLNPGPRDLADVTTAIREIDRLERVRRAQPITTSWAFDVFEYVQNDGFRKPYRYSDPPATIPFRDFTHLMPRISYVSPERSLGGLISGTLNFSKEYSTKLIDMGYQDGIRFLNATGLK